MTGFSAKRQAALLAVLTMLLWSAVFSSTYGYSFYWDDLHFIRPYSWAEILSTFHGPTDPDGIETMALRPIATLIFFLQGTVFGDNLVLQRAFMAVLMGGFLWSVGLLLSELGLTMRHIAVVFALFASSRVFASLMLWITLGSLILSYVFLSLSAFAYLVWTRTGRRRYLALTVVLAALAVFTREEAYTLPVVLPVLWFISSTNRENVRRAVTGALAVAAILVVHMFMRMVFVPDAPPIRLSAPALVDVIHAAQSAWMPSGFEVVGYGDQLIRLLWIGFL